MQQILGIEPTGAGFHQVTIRPDLAGLRWVHATEPTPRGLIRVSIELELVHLELPPETTALVSLPFTPGHEQVFENGRPIPTSPAEGRTRSVVTLSNAGSYTFTKKGEFK